MLKLAGTLDREIRKRVQLNYLIYLPANYNIDLEARWPLILFLHGSRERGDNLPLVEKYGLPIYLNKTPDFPFVVVVPQCPQDDSWVEHTDALDALLDDVLAAYQVDPARLYLTGLSMGGTGVWNLAIAYPERFAAIAPICGRGTNGASVGHIKKLPIWVFHGAKDPVVPVSESERMVKLLQEVGADVQFTIYPEATHDSWTETYDNPELYRWFLTHSR